MKEIWSNLPYLPKDIQVSSFGRIRHWDSYFGYGTILTTSKLESQERIYIRSKAYYIHRLVADAFIPNPDRLRFVIHKDGNNFNNRADNLEWKNRSVENRTKYSSSKKLYCPELDEVFGTMDTVSFVLHLPLNIVNKAVREGKKICGYSFEVWKKDDPRLQERKILYIGKEKFFEIATTSDSVEACTERLWRYLKEDCTE